MTASSLDFQHLSPEFVLDAVEELGFAVNGRMLALNSYENRVYQLGIEDGPPLIAKFYRPGRWTDQGILEEHQFVAELVEREIPVVAALMVNGNTLHHATARSTLTECSIQERATCPPALSTMRFALFPQHAGRAPELDHPETLEWMGRFIGRIHAVGALASYVERPSITLQSFGVASRDYLIATHAIPPELLTTYTSTTTQALEDIARCFERAGAIPHLRLHGDCHPGNVLWTDAGPHFVDFDDSRMGPAMQDIWMLLSGSRQDMRRQLGDILAGYEDFYEFHPRELHLIEALRTLRLMHYSAWLAQRWNDPAFKIAFPWFASPMYWSDRIAELREQCVLMSEDPLWHA